MAQAGDFSLEQQINQSLRKIERARKAEVAARAIPSSLLGNSGPELERQVVSSSNGSIVNNPGDDWTSLESNHKGRPQSTTPDTRRFRNLGLQESSPGKSRKRRAPEPHRGKSERRDVHPKREAPDPDFDRGDLHRGVKNSLFEPGINQKYTAYDYDAAAGTVAKLSRPRDVSTASPPQRQGWNASHPNLKNSSSLTGTNDPTSHHAGPGQNEPSDSFRTSKWKILSQPETRPISEDQLVKEVRGIYAGLVMVEKKCIEIDQQQARGVKKHVEEGAELETLTKEQWQALIAMHRTLLHEHHDFFLASQHPSASRSLQNLPQKYAMPARMWRHGIHSFLEILRQRLPDSLEHMLSFIYLTYSMMTLLVESIPAFKDTWIECLGDLARYRMAVEESDIQDREVWAGVARYWYNQGADRNPNTGRIQHHLAVLARSNILQQLFFYTKSLVCVQPFPNTTDSIRQLFNATYQLEHHRLHPVMTSFTDVHRTLFLFTCDSAQSFIRSVDKFIPYLNNQISRVGAKWREQGVYIASTNISAILGYGKPENILMQLLRGVQDSNQILQKAIEYWNSPPDIEVSSQPETSISEISLNNKQLTSVDILPFASGFSFYTLGSVVQHIGDKNVIPYVHVSLAFLWSLALVPDSMRYIETEVPWRAIERFLNNLPRQGTSESRIQSEKFPKSGIILPEDYLLRGQIWSERYYPENYFEDSPLDLDERPLELPSIAAPRAERCLWLGARISMFNRWLTYDSKNKTFATTQLASGFETAARAASPFGRKCISPSPESPKNIKMVDVESRYYGKTIRQKTSGKQHPAATKSSGTQCPGTRAQPLRSGMNNMVATGLPLPDSSSDPQIRKVYEVLCCGQSENCFLESYRHQYIY